MYGIKWEIPMNIRSTDTVELIVTKQNIAAIKVPKDVEIRLLNDIEQELVRRGPASVAASLLRYAV